ncbi:MAG: FHA domain-containing protein, partial [Planctomycetota bacterium]
MTGGQANDPQPAYLVLRHAGRWSDVYRLGSQPDAILGRSSSNPIALRSHQASRRHARVFWRGESLGWAIEDLGSRNGTSLNGQKVERPTPLSDGDTIEIGGFSIQFTRRMEGLPQDGGSFTSVPSEDQVTEAFAPETITDRREQSRY